MVSLCTIAKRGLFVVVDICVSSLDRVARPPGEMSTNNRGGTIQYKVDNEHVIDDVQQRRPKYIVSDRTQETNGENQGENWGVSKTKKSKI